MESLCYFWSPRNSPSRNGPCMPTGLMLRAKAKTFPWRLDSWHLQLLSYQRSFWFPCLPEILQRPYIAKKTQHSFPTLRNRIGGNTIEERNVAFPQHGERVVFDRASTLDVAYANGAAELRFYAVSPRAIHELKAGALKKAGKGAVAAVVKIDMSTEHLGFLCKKLETLISKDDMPAY